MKKRVCMILVMMLFNGQFIFTLGLFNNSCTDVVLKAHEKGSITIEKLIKRLKHPRAVVRADSACILGRRKEKTAVLGLCEALRDRHIRVRHCAIRALLKIGDKRAVLPICKLLNERAYETRSLAAWALGHFKDKRAVPALLELRDDNEPLVRFVAKIAVRRIKNSPFLKLLFTGIQNSDWYVRMCAAQEMAQFKNHRVITVLIIALKDPYWWVRDIAVQSLVKIGRKALPRLRQIKKLTDKSTATRIKKIIKQITEKKR